MFYSKDLTALRLELFSSIRVGSNTHLRLSSVRVAKQTCFRLIFAKMVTSQSPWAQSRTKPNARKECLWYLVLSVSPQYHCRFNDFFETTRHGGPDVSGTISWQQIAGLDRASMILSDMSAPIQRSAMYPETPSEGDVPPEEFPFSPPVFNVTLD